MTNDASRRLDDDRSPDDSPSEHAPPRAADGPDLMDRYAPFLAIAAMIATFIVLPSGFALTLIGAIWLGLTRGLGRRRVLALTLTEALAWAAAIAIVEFLAVLVLFVASGSRPA